MMTFEKLCKLIAAKKGVAPEQVEKELTDYLKPFLTTDFVQYGKDTTATQA